MQKILENLRINKKIAGFEARMNREVAMLEKAAFKAEKEDYQSTLDRVNAIKEKYKNFRLESYRKKLQDLGIQVQGDEDKSALIEKERKLLFQKQHRWPNHGYTGIVELTDATYQEHFYMVFQCFCHEGSQFLAIQVHLPIKMMDLEQKRKSGNLTSK